MKPGIGSIAADIYRRSMEGAYRNASGDPQEIEAPRATIIAVDGDEPPGSNQFRAAISALYSVGYTLKMGLKFNKLPRPEGYFDYAIGAFQTIWWPATGAGFDISGQAGLSWKAFLVVPDFVTTALVKEAALQSRERHPENDTSAVRLDVVNEGHCVQAMHVGPYGQEKPTIDSLQKYIASHGMAVDGPHHEIYISDPNRTPPEKLKTVIRYPVKGQGEPGRLPPVTP